MIEQPAAEAVRLLAIVEAQAVFGDALYAEVVGHGADREDEIVEADRVRPDQLAAVVVEQRRDLRLRARSRSMPSRVPRKKR